MYDSLIVTLDDISYYKTIFCRGRPQHLFIGLGNFILGDKEKLIMSRLCQGVLWAKEKNLCYIYCQQYPYIGSYEKKNDR